MKFFFLIAVIFFLMSCLEKKVVTSTKEQFTTEGQTERTSQMLNDLQEYNLLFMNALIATTRSTEGVEPYVTISNISGSDITVLPYYHFDTDSFYNHPTPDYIPHCLSQPKDEIWFVGLSKSNNQSYKISAKQKDAQWVMQEYTSNWWDLIAWLPEKLEEAHTDSYKIFMVNGQEFITYLKENHPIYRDISGTEIPPHQLSELFLSLIKQRKEMQEYFQKKDLK